MKFLFPFFLFLFLTISCTNLEKSLKPSDSLFLRIGNLKFINFYAVIPYFTTRGPLISKVDEIARPTRSHIKGPLEIIDPKLACSESAHVKYFITLFIFFFGGISRFTIIAILHWSLISTQPGDENSALIFANLFHVFHCLHLKLFLLSDDILQRLPHVLTFFVIIWVHLVFGIIVFSQKLVKSALHFLILHDSFFILFNFKIG